jgi:hypothetical protein
MQAGAGRGNATQESRIVLETVVEPIIRGLEADENAGRLTVARDYNVLLHRLAQVIPAATERYANHRLGASASNRCAAVLPERVATGHSPTGSCGCEQHALKRWRLAVIEPICQYAKRECLRLGLRLLHRVTVDEHTWQLLDLGDPPTVFLALDFHLESHTRTIAQPGVKTHR